VTIPGNAYSVKLRYYDYTISSEAIYGAQSSPVDRENAPKLGELFGLAPLSGDWQYVLVLNQNYDLVESLVWKLTDIHEWTFHQIGLLRYAGKTIILQFGTYNDGWDGISAMYVDDVVLEVCTP